MDQYQDLRSEMVLNLQKCGITVEVHHHEVATGGQTEIDMRFGTMTKMADKVLLYKYVVKNTARKRGKVVTVMPKPLFQDNGSGMHCHQSLWKGGKNIFYDKKGYGLISDTARYYIGGIDQARPRAVRLYRPHDQFVPQTGARLRSADQLGVLGQKPQRLRENSDVLHQREGQAAGVSGPPIRAATRILPFRPC